MHLPWNKPFSKFKLLVLVTKRRMYNMWGMHGQKINDLPHILPTDNQYNPHAHIIPTSMSINAPQIINSSTFSLQGAHAKINDLSMDNVWAD